MSDDGKNPNMMFYESSNNNSARTRTATTLEVEFSTNTNVTSNNNNGYFEEQQNRRSTVVPVVSRIGLNSNGTTFDGTSYGNWISATPSTTAAAAVHSFQTAKQNLSVVFQTPIFGME